ncbi:hypothetical protein R1sor_023782 [Riccia sorocarpa]|uniref:Uncharacterized protein n=1 Tax=Riccia sorocarpa TaxID=122646 RepID=A0ABD3GQ54_9MARC
MASKRVPSKQSLAIHLMVVGFTGVALGVLIGIFISWFGFASRVDAELWRLQVVHDRINRPRGTEGLPSGIVVPETDLYQRRLWGRPSEDLPDSLPKYLAAFTIGIKQKDMVNQAVSKFLSNFTIVLFHYDGVVDEWNDLEWSKTAIHISIPRQTKWWYAKRFLHPDVVAPYDYIFIWDEDLDLENLDPLKYIELARKYGLEISQPALEVPWGTEPSWRMTKRRDDVEVHNSTEEKKGRCESPHRPPCAGFVEIMAPVFSRKAWRCVWHMIQNDLVHGWGIDLNLHRCAQPAYEKIGVVDAQWIKHRKVATLGEKVQDRCRWEWDLFKSRFAEADRNETASIPPA